MLIYGDYDVDGIMSVLVLQAALQRLGAQPQCYIPHRLHEGYGVRASVLEQAASSGVGLVITVDNGMRAHEEMALARQLGLDVIITDHHSPGDTLPPAVAVVNPMRRDSTYPNQGLCGVGVAFKLAQALLQAEARIQQDEYPPWLQTFFKLVAIGTIADYAPLLQENRVFVRLGLKGLEHPVNPGLRALLRQALPDSGPIRSSDIAFQLAPRLNAAGRMEHGNLILQLFAADSALAGDIALRLEKLNLQRKASEAGILEAIAGQTRVSPELLNNPVLSFIGEGWHRGVLGIVAARLQRMYRRPALVMTSDDVTAHGSGRAEKGVDLLQCLQPCAPLFERFGGHAQAIGFTMSTENSRELQRYLSAVKIPQVVNPPGEISLCLQLDEILPLAQDLKKLEPFGAGNPEPRCSSQVRLLSGVQWIKEKHIKFIAGSSRLRLECLGWNFSAQETLVADGIATRVDELRPGQWLELHYRIELPRNPDRGPQLILLKDSGLSSIKLLGDNG